MADFPFLPMSVAAFMADTQHLDARETGAYAALIFNAWLSRDCGLPDDDKKLARLARCSPREWLQIKTTVMAFWQLMEDGLWHQKKLDKVRASVIVKSSKARASALAKHLKNNDSTSANAERTPSDGYANQNQNQNYISHGKISVEPPGAPAPEGARSGSGLTSPEEWRKRLAKWIEDGTWSPRYGLRPDSSGTNPIIPADLLQWAKAQKAQARQGAAG